MDDPNAPAPPAEPLHAEPPPTHPRRTRRWFLVAGGAVAVGAGAGAAAEVVQRRPQRIPPPPPAELVAAATAERTLLADLDATTGGSPAVRRVLRQVRADHAAHLSTLDGLVAHYGAARSRSAAPSSAPAGRPRTRAQLHAAEQRASHGAAARAARLTGAHAVLLASIAACEATHADLLA